MVPGKRIVYVATSPLSLRTFLRDPLRRLRDAGHDVHAVCTGGAAEIADLAGELGVEVHAVPMHRRIDPLADVRAVLVLRRVLRRLRPDLLHAHTPKGGLVGMLAASLAAVPARCYTVHGLARDTRTGWRRALLIGSERLTCGLAHRVFCVSHSLRSELVEGGMCAPDKVEVLGHGSVAGVDPDRFARSPDVERSVVDVRRSLRIPPGDRILGYLGRLTRDKGVVELAEAWPELARAHPTWHLLLVGEYDETDPVPGAVRQRLSDDPRVHHVGWQPDVVPYLAAMDVLTLPTHREGFGLVLIEAAALGVPTVAGKVIGVVDAVVDGKTGLLVPPRDAAALRRTLDQVMADAGLRASLGAAGRQWAVESFGPDDLWQRLLEEYERLLVTP
jgi:glycosyltransferase involved in cell wall biosynthesis